LQNIALTQTEITLKAQARIKRMGLELADQPVEGMPPLPKQPSMITDDQLMELYAQFVRWADYLNGQLALAEIDENYCKGMVEKSEALAILSVKMAKTDTATALKAARDGDPTVIEKRSEFDQAHAYRKLLGVMFSNSERDAQFLSRELTRRLGIAAREYRT
jgi:hypothetical protein